MWAVIFLRVFQAATAEVTSNQESVAPDQSSESTARVTRLPGASFPPCDAGRAISRIADAREAMPI